MAETEASQTWVSTGRGGAGNFPYTPRALSKRPVTQRPETFSAPQGREVDFRKQGIARSGRGGVGYWEPTLDEGAKVQQSEDFERDREVIKERAMKRQSVVTDGAYVFRSARGGAGTISSPVEQTLPTTNPNGQDAGAPLERVHSFGRGGGNFRYGDAIPLVELNRIETQERIEAKNKPPSTTPTAESGFATFASYTSAFFNSLTPAENRIENMPSPTSPTSYASKPVSGGGRGGAGNLGYATYTPSKARNTNNSVPPASPASNPGPASPSQAHLRSENHYSAYSSSAYASQQGYYDPERPPAGSSSPSNYASGSGSSSSNWA